MGATLLLCHTGSTHRTLYSTYQIKMNSLVVLLPILLCVHIVKTQTFAEKLQVFIGETPNGYTISKMVRDGETCHCRVPASSSSSSSALTATTVGLSASASVAFDTATTAGTGTGTVIAAGPVVTTGTTETTTGTTETTTGTTTGTTETTTGTTTVTTVFVSSVLTG